jgi:hypothetical protein
MARAFLTLYTVTGDRVWLVRSEASAKFIEKNFHSPAQPGYLTARKPIDRASIPHLQRDENIMVLRFVNLLAHYTGNSAYNSMAQNAMKYLAAPSIAQRLPAASMLLADQEFSFAPLHLTVVGKKSDPSAQQLFSAAAAYPSSYKRLEWWDTTEGPLPNPDVKYPQLARAAVFICTNRTCSAPIFQASDIRSKIERLAAKGGPDQANLQKLTTRTARTGVSSRLSSLCNLTGLWTS